MSTPEFTYADLIAFACGELSEIPAKAVAEYVRNTPAAADTVRRYQTAHRAVLSDDAIDPPPALVAQAKTIFAASTMERETSWIKQLGTAIAQLTFDNRVHVAGTRLGNPDDRIQLSYEFENIDVDLLIERIEPTPGDPEPIRWRLMGQVDHEDDQPIVVTAVTDEPSKTATQTTASGSTFTMTVAPGRYDIILRLREQVITLPDLLVE